MTDTPLFLITVAVDRDKLFRAMETDPAYVSDVLKETVPAVLLSGRPSLKEDVRLEMIGLSFRAMEVQTG